MFITLHCPKCQHLWKFPFTVNLCQLPHLHIFSILREAVWKMCLEKSRLQSMVRCCPAESLGQNGWQRIHIKDRLLFSHHTMPSLQSNGPHWMNSITHTVIFYSHCRVRRDSLMGIQFYHSAPSKLRRKSERVEKYFPQDVCDRHFKCRMCYLLLSHWLNSLLINTASKLGLIAKCNVLNTVTKKKKIVGLVWGQSDSEKLTWPGPG